MKELPWALKDWSYEAMKQKQTDSDEIVRELRDWSRIYGHALGPTYTQMNDRAASRILALKADLAQAQRNASNALDDYHTLKAELASVKAERDICLETLEKCSKITNKQPGESADEAVKRLKAHADAMATAPNQELLNRDREAYRATHQKDAP